MAKDNLIKIGGELKSVAADGVVAGAEAIYDYTEGKSQATINQDLKDAIEDIDVSDQISGKANKSEMSVVAGTGANADKTTITLKNGTSATVLTQHQDVSEFIKEGEVFGTGDDSTASFNPYSDTVWSKAQTLSESQKQQIRENIGVGAADNEDIQNVNGELKFADKAYNTSSHSGLGRKYLRKNVVDNKNVLTQAMVNTANTIYHIQYDYDLNGQTITIPAGCVLKFEGGSLNNGMLNGNNTGIDALPSVTIFSNIEIDGTWDVHDIYVEWMNIPDPSDCGAEVRSILRLQSDGIQQNIYLPSFNIAYTPQSSNWPNRRFINLSSNTNLLGCVDKTISVNRNNLTQFDVVFCYEKENVSIKNIHVIGDVGNHEYVEGSTSELGHGITVFSSSNITIENCISERNIGDGLSLGAATEEGLGQFLHANINISVIDCKFKYNRRQGCSCCHAKNLSFIGCEFSYTGQIENTRPSRGIDLEVNDETQGFENILVDKCIFIDNISHDFTILYSNYNKNIVINDSVIGISTIYDENGYNVYPAGTTDDTGIYMHGVFEGFEVRNSTISRINVGTFERDISYLRFINCDVHSLVHWSNTPSSVSPLRFIFDNCRFSPKKVKFNTYNAMFFVRCIAFLEFNNCIFNPIDCIGGNNESITSNLSTVRGDYNNCEYHGGGLCGTISARNTLFYSSIRTNVAKGEVLQFINNTITPTERYYIQITGTREFIENPDVANTKIIFKNNNFVNSDSMLYVIWAYNSNLVDVYFDGYIPIDFTKAINEENVRSAIVNIFADRQYVNGSIVRGLEKGQYGWYCLGQVWNHSGGLRLVGIDSGNRFEGCIYYKTGVNRWIFEITFLLGTIGIEDTTIINGNLYVKRSSLFEYYTLVRENQSSFWLDSFVYIGANDSDLPAGTRVRVFTVFHSGDTSNLPELANLYPGYCYFNTTTGKPVWVAIVNGVKTWVDALGNPVSTIYPQVIGTPTNGNLAKFNGTNIEDSGNASI